MVMVLGSSSGKKQELTGLKLFHMMKLIALKFDGGAGGESLVPFANFSYWKRCFSLHETE